MCSIRKRPDFSSSGQWEVGVEADEVQKMYIFDGIMVCSGHYTEKHFPLQDFAGISLVCVRERRLLGFYCFSIN